MSTKVYTLTITEEQARVISIATELFSRVCIGQTDDLRFWKPKANIGMHDTCDEGQLAWDLYQVIRHRLAWDRAGNPPVRDWKTMMTVDFDEPLKIGPEPLAGIKHEET